MIKKLLAATLILVLCACSSAEPVLPQSIGLTGVDNARELGGYPTQDGRTVRHGVLLRSASLADATDEDIQRLVDNYHLSTVIDLRMTGEVEASPDPEIPGVRNLHLSIIDEEAMATKQKNRSPKDVERPDVANKIDLIKEAIKAGVFSDQMYVEWLSSETGKTGYAQLFRKLIDQPDGEALLFHCTQGKDRTGCAAMLILSALDVDEDTILKDYTLTNTFNADLIASERKMLSDAGIEGEEQDQYIKAMDGVNEQYMVNALDWMTEKYGSAMGYIVEELDVTEAEIEQLRDRYLEGEAAYARDA